MAKFSKTTGSRRVCYVTFHFELNDVWIVCTVMRSLEMYLRLPKKNCKSREPQLQDLGVSSVIIFKIFGHRHLAITYHPIWQVPSLTLGLLNQLLPCPLWVFQLGQLNGDQAELYQPELELQQHLLRSNLICRIRS